MSKQAKTIINIRLVSLAFVLSFITQTGWTQQDQVPASDESSVRQSFGGPASVPGQIADDARLTDSLTDRTFLENYFDWKDRVLEDTGLNYTVDYTALIDNATNTIGSENTFSGGAFRIFGTWDLAGRESGNTGSFVFKIENRHRYSDIAPNKTASQVGYTGLMFPTISNIGNRLTNLYWRQNLNEDRLELIAGMIDVTDWVDVYALASPWTGFSNFSFATGGAAIPTPDDATLGAYVNAMLTNNLYVIGGFADSNSNSTDPFEGFNTFGDHEFFKTIELGWVTSRDRFYLDNTHLTYWHVDERVEAGVPEGWGVNFSYEQSFDEKWMPFVRGGYAKDGGSFLQKTLATGVGYHFGENNSLLGFGVHWGEPNEETYGPGLDDQFTTELFTRLQVMRNLQLTPDIQYVKNPALNPDADESWIVGLRARLIF